MEKFLLCCGNVLKAVVDTSNIVVEFDGSGNISNLSDIVADVKEQVQEKVADVKEQVQEKVEDVKEQVQEKVEDVQKTTETINNAVNLAENIVQVTEELNKDTKV